MQSFYLEFLYLLLYNNKRFLKLKYKRKRNMLKADIKYNINSTCDPIEFIDVSFYNADNKKICQYLNEIGTIFIEQKEAKRLEKITKLLSFSDNNEAKIDENLNTIYKIKKHNIFYFLSKRLRTQIKDLENINKNLSYENNYFYRTIIKLSQLSPQSAQEIKYDLECFLNNIGFAPSSNFKICDNSYTIQSYNCFVTEEEAYSRAKKYKDIILQPPMDKNQANNLDNLQRQINSIQHYTCNDFVEEK